MQLLDWLRNALVHVGNDWGLARLKDTLAVLSESGKFVEALTQGGFIASVIGFAGSAGVFVFARLRRWYSAWAGRRITRYSIDVGPWPLQVGSVENVKLRCLVVRYGTDAYVERLASDQEKYEGRLRNRILKNRVTIVRTRADGLWPWLGYRWKRFVLGYEPMERESTRIVGNFLLPVHKRLGTQFKLFFEIRADQAAIKALGLHASTPSATPAQEPTRRTEAGSEPKSRAAEIQAARHIAEHLALQYGLASSNVTEVREYRSLRRFLVRWLVFPASARLGQSDCRYHLWFCIDGFTTVKTVEGITNNMCFPV